MKTFLTVFLWAWCSVCFAGSHSVAILLGSGGTCSTPATGDEFNEGFLGSGYETTWSEAIGSATIDEDQTLTGTPPSGSCSEGLGVAFTVGGTVSTTTHDLGAEISNTIPTDISIEIRVNSVSFSADFQLFHVLATNLNSSGGAAISSGAYLDIARAAGNVISIRARGQSNSSFVTLSVGSWHTIIIHRDPTAANSYVTVDGGAQNTFTRGADSGMRYIHLGLVGPAADNATATGSINYEIGRIWVNTP